MKQEMWPVLQINFIKQQHIYDIAENLLTLVVRGSEIIENA